MDAWAVVSSLRDQNREWSKRIEDGPDIHVVYATVQQHQIDGFRRVVEAVALLNDGGLRHRHFAIGNRAFYRIHANYRPGVRQALKSDSRVGVCERVADEDVEFIGLR